MISKAVFFFIITRTLAEVEDDFYCVRKDEQYEKCNRCSDKLSGNCDNPTDCHCGNIRVYDEISSKFIGGSECSEGFCYIGIDSSTCPDKDDGYDEVATELTPRWHENAEEIFRSTKACDNSRIMNTGNHEIMENVELTDDYLFGVEEQSTGGETLLNYNSTTPFTFYAQDHQDCIDECVGRCGKCGGWSFEKGAGICRIFTADACCGQLNKQRANKNFTSGYNCNQCWTTRGQCPSYCSLKERQKNKCGTSHNTGAVSPQFTTPTGKGGVVPLPFNEDKCRCEKRMVGRGRFRRCRCIKPRCFDETLNPNGLCQDERRCRKRKVNFPRC